MTSTDSPAVARRRLRLALRKAREAKGCTQAEVAEALEWSLSKINRIESGEVTISHTDLRALLDYLAIVDKQTVDRLAEDARAARRRGWWDDPRYRAHLTPATLQLLQFETEANAIRCFQPTLLPGIIQIEGYANSIMGMWGEELSEEDRGVRVEVRLRRRQHVLGRPDSPQLHLVLDESVILREIGGAHVMADQLQCVLDLIEQGQVRGRMVPLTQPIAGGLTGPFMIFDFDGDENAVLYREDYFGDAIVQNPEQVHRHRRSFERLWDNAMSEEATVRRLQARLAAMLSSFDHIDAWRHRST